MRRVTGCFRHCTNRCLYEFFNKGFFAVQPIPQRCICMPFSIFSSYMFICLRFSPQGTTSQRTMTIRLQFHNIKVCNKINLSSQTAIDAEISVIRRVLGPQRNEKFWRLLFVFDREDFCSPKLLIKYRFLNSRCLTLQTVE